MMKLFITFTSSSHPIPETLDEPLPVRLTQARPLPMFLLVILVVVSAVLIHGGRKTLRPLFHLLSVLLVLPSVLFAGACLALRQAVAHDSVFGFFDAILSFVVVMYPWGTAVLLACLLTLVAAGFRARWRRTAAGAVIVLAVGSATVMHQVAGMPADADQCWLLFPGLLSVLIAGWLVFTRRPGSREFALRHPGGFCIDRYLREKTLREFQGRPGFARQPEGAAGWAWYTLPTFRDGALPLGVKLGFQRGALQQINLFHDDPALYGATGETGPADKERLRASNTRDWLRAKGFPVGSYPWGEVWVGYDPRSDFGSGGVRYTPSATPGPADVTPDPAVLPSPVNMKPNSITLRILATWGMTCASSLDAQSPAPGCQFFHSYHHGFSGGF